MSEQTTELIKKLKVWGEVCDYPNLVALLDDKITIPDYLTKATKNQEKRTLELEEDLKIEREKLIATPDDKHRKNMHEISLNKYNEAKLHLDKLKKLQETKSEFSSS